MSFDNKLNNIIDLKNDEIDYKPKQAVHELQGHITAIGCEYDIIIASYVVFTGNSWNK